MGAGVLLPCYTSNLDKREWRNWQTRQLEVLVGVKSRGGSSPLSRIEPNTGLFTFLGMHSIIAGTHPMRQQSRANLLHRFHHLG